MTFLKVHSSFDLRAENRKWMSGLSLNTYQNERWGWGEQGGSSGELTLVNPAIFFSDVGVRSPDHHLADVRWVLSSNNECSYAPVTPAQEGHLLELQHLWAT